MTHSSGEVSFSPEVVGHVAQQLPILPVHPQIGREAPLSTLFPYTTLFRSSLGSIKAPLIEISPKQRAGRIRSNDQRSALVTTGYDERTGCLSQRQLILTIASAHV